MELSIDYILELPRPTATDIIEKLIKEKQDAIARVQELTAQVVKFEQEKNAKKMVEPPTEPEELERAPTMNFGLVFEDHEALLQQVHDKDEEIERLRTKNSKHKAKNLKYKAMLAEEKDRSDKSHVNRAEGELNTQEADSGSGEAWIQNSEIKVDAHGVPFKMVQDIQLSAFLDVNTESALHSSWPTRVNDAHTVLGDLTHMQPELPKNLCSRTIMALPRHFFILGDGKYLSSVLVIDLRSALDIETLKWTRCKPRMARDHTFDLVIQAGNKGVKWIYAGQYKCAFSKVMATKDAIGNRDRIVWDHLRDSIFGPLRQLSGSLRRAAPSIFGAGTFEVICYGLRRIGYSHDLADALRSPKTIYRFRSEPEPDKTPSGIAKTSKKRQRAGEGTRDEGEDLPQPKASTSKPSRKRRKSE